MQVLLGHMLLQFFQREGPPHFITEYETVLCGYAVSFTVTEDRGHSRFEAEMAFFSVRYLKVGHILDPFFNRLHVVFPLSNLYQRQKLELHI